MSALPPSTDADAHASIVQIAANELVARIQYFALGPERVLLLGNRSRATAEALLKAFPRADMIAFDAVSERTGSEITRRSWWPRRQPLHRVRGQATALPLRAQTADLACINFLLPACPQPEQALREVARVLRPDALVLLSSLGPRSLPELASPPGQYPDLPQLGELLLGCGFVEPVMDIEHHQLGFASGEALARELRWLSIDELPIDPLSRTLTFELIVAAAFVADAGAGAAPVNAAGETVVPVSSLRRRVR